MNTAIAPTQEEIIDIKEKISEQKRAMEYQKLKQKLEEITTKAVNTPNDLDGVMQIPDTDRILIARRAVSSIVEKIIDGAVRMCAIQPIIGNLIALALPVLGVILLTMLSDLALQHNVSWVEKALPYLMKSSIISVAIVIIISSSRSLLLPLLGMILSVCFCSMLQHDY